MNTNEAHIPIAHYCGTFLTFSEHFIYQLVTNHMRFAPVVLSHLRANAEATPVEKCISLDSMGRYSPQWIIDRLLARLTGTSGFMLRAAHREKVCLVHAHYGPTGVLALPFSKRLGIPLITSFYGGLDRNPRLLARYRILFNEGSAFFVEGNHMKKELESFGCSPDKIHVIHLGIDLPSSLPPRRSSASERQKILFIGRFVEKKGLEYLLRAAQILKCTHDFQLDIYGGAVRETITNYPQMANELGLKDHVVFHGILWRDKLLDILRAREHSFIVVPSVLLPDGRGEGGFPTVLTMAAAHALPAVATRHCDIPEIVIDQLTGFLCEERDPQDLARRMADLLEDNSLQDTMGTAAREHVRKHYALDDQIQQTEEVYSRILGSA